MNKLIAAIALIISSILITSCGNSPNKPVNETKNNSKNDPVETTLGESSPEISIATDETKGVANTTASNNQANTNKTQPKIGTVKELVIGDIICYATIVDEQRKEHPLGASFEICAEAEKYLNRKVRVSYEIASLNDCQSIEPCGKTRRESIISQMEIIADKSLTKPQASDSQTFNNGKWTITIGNRNSWSGVNNTGNLTYKGCDAQGNCINLTGGKVSCRDGKCVTGWVNGDYRYILSQPITEDGNASPTLIVNEGDKEILNATGFKIVSR
ncbi:hypothetical protein [Umezakia ovalisporum]|uniref:hypothetical protein n=1 Tax=Umezakia ovalisporum TaxID=75695 RepID=UPI0035B96B2B